MTSTVYTDSTITRTEFGHVWRDDHGTAYATVRLGQASITFGGVDGPAVARAVAAACTQAAGALEALPPAPEGGQS